MNQQYSGQFGQSSASYHSWPRYEGRSGGRSLHLLRVPTFTMPRGTFGMLYRNGGRGFGGRGFPRSGPRFPYGRIMKRRFTRNKPFEFKQLPESAKYKEYPVTPDNILCFSGFQNVFTAQHDFPLDIDGRWYENVNHFYQLAKTEALCGVTSLLMTSASDESDMKELKNRSPASKDYNTLARNILKINKVDRNAAEEWRRTAGLEAMQRALLAKVEQCEELRSALLDSGDKILIHCFGGDDFYASACNHKYIQDWAKSMQSNKVIIKIPLDFPLTTETVVHIPKFGLGRNALGVIYMQLREMTTEELHAMDVQPDESSGASIVPSVPAPIKNESHDSTSNESSFIIGGSSISNSSRNRSSNGTSRNILSVPLEYLASFGSK